MRGIADQPDAPSRPGRQRLRVIERPRAPASTAIARNARKSGANAATRAEHVVASISPPQPSRGLASSTMHDDRDLGAGAHGIVHDVGVAAEPDAGHRLPGQPEPRPPGSRCAPPSCRRRRVAMIREQPRRTVDQRPSQPISAGPSNVPAATVATATPSASHRRPTSAPVVIAISGSARAASSSAACRSARCATR